jgi:hypothetical protein
MSDPFAVDRLREQLVDAVMPDAERWGYPEDAFDGAKAFADASLPIIIAFGDAREAAGREQGKGWAVMAIEAEQAALVANGYVADESYYDDGWHDGLTFSAGLIRAQANLGSGVAVQPTPGKQP